MKQSKTAHVLLRNPVLKEKKIKKSDNFLNATWNRVAKYFSSGKRGIFN